MESEISFLFKSNAYYNPFNGKIIENSGPCVISHSVSGLLLNEAIVCKIQSFYRVFILTTL